MASNDVSTSSSSQASPETVRTPCNTGLMQTSEIQIALAIMQIERRMLTLIARTLGLAHHHIGLGATAGTNLKAATRARGSCGDKLGVKVRGHGSSTLKYARRNRNLSIDRSMTAGNTGATSCDRYGSGLVAKAFSCRASGAGARLPAKLSAPSGVSNDAIMRAHSQRGKPIRRDRRTKRRSDSSASTAAKSSTLSATLCRTAFARPAADLAPLANQLNSLTHGNAARRMQVEHLEGRNTKRHANARRNLFGLIEKLIEQLVQNTLRGGYTQRQAGGKSGIALVNSLGRCARTARRAHTCRGDRPPSAHRAQACARETACS